jgi:Recombinase
MSLAAIADKLNAQGISRREGAAWEHTYLSRLISKSA